MNCVETDLVIDGGNVVPCGDYFVMTDKVFAENGKPKNDPGLIEELQKLFGHEIIFIPWTKHKGEPYGHADGFVKYIGWNKVIMGNHRDLYPKEADAIRKCLEQKGFEITELTYDVEKPDLDKNWAYINFLQVGNKIIMPVFSIEEDEQAKQQIQNALPWCEIHVVDCTSVAKDGGAIHCITWNALFDPHADMEKPVKKEFGNEALFSVLMDLIPNEVNIKGKPFSDEEICFLCSQNFKKFSDKYPNLSEYYMSCLNQ